MATLLIIDKLDKSYGPRVIFENAYLAIQEKQKVGVIGRNGAGKSTLFRMIVGVEEWDSGNITIPSITNLGYLQQQEQIDPAETVMEFLERTTGKETWQCAKVASKFELKDKLTSLLSALSGGYRMRVKLTAMLLHEPNLFLLDEPTNYLDLHTQLLLENFLQNYHGAFLIISHDREFLKRTCEETLEVENGKLFLYPRPVEEYLEYKEQKLAYAQMYNKKVENEQKHLQVFVDRFRYKASKAKQAQSKLKAIERLKKVEIDSPLSTVRISIPGVVHKKGLALRSDELSIGYIDKIIADNINIDIDRGEHVAILGDNGQGKTTFLKTLAGELSKINGTFKWCMDAKVAYYAQHVPSELDPNEKVWRYLRRIASIDIIDEDVLKMAGNFLFDEGELQKDIAVLSGGERARLCLAGILLSQSNILLLDEPTNHLDFETVEALGRALEDYAGTVLFISHNRTFVNSVATSIIEVKAGKVRRYLHTYEEYVYHMAESIAESEEANKNKAIVKKVPDKIDKKQRYEEMKEYKNKLKELEEEIWDLEKDKLRLLRVQDRDPKKFTMDNYTVLGEISKQIEQKEASWLEIQSKIEETTK